MFNWNRITTMTYLAEGRRWYRLYRKPQFNYLSKELLLHQTDSNLAQNRHSRTGVVKDMVNKKEQVNLFHAARFTYIDGYKLYY